MEKGKKKKKGCEQWEEKQEMRPWIKSGLGDDSQAGYKFCSSLATDVNHTSQIKVYQHK